MTLPVITIDGPAGAGKTTVSRGLAARLNYRYVDTGALYRGVAVEAARDGIAEDDVDGLAVLCRDLELTFSDAVDAEGAPRLMANGKDITDRIRTPQVTMAASAISAHPVVREFLLRTQRDLGKSGGVVFEGRDMGTVVFPDADIKFFLTADLETRAIRRFRELPPSAGQSLEMVQRDMRRRDRNDSTREVAPLKPASDAIQIDSSRQSIDGVIDSMIAKIRARTASE